MITDSEFNDLMMLAERISYNKHQLKLRPENPNRAKLNEDLTEDLCDQIEQLYFKIKHRREKMKLELLKEWERNIKSSDEVLGKFGELFGCFTGPAVESIEAMQTAYTDAISRLVGDDCRWLEWYRTDNAMGDAGYATGWNGDPKPITNIEGLLELIEASNND